MVAPQLGILRSTHTIYIKSKRSTYFYYLILSLFITMFYVVPTIYTLLAFCPQFLHIITSLNQNDQLEGVIRRKCRLLCFLNVYGNIIVISWIGYSISVGTTFITRCYLSSILGLIHPFVGLTNDHYNKIQYPSVIRIWTWGNISSVDLGLTNVLDFMGLSSCYRNQGFQ